MITRYSKQISVVIFAMAIAFYNCTNVSDKKEKFLTSPKNNYTLDIKIKGAANKMFYLYRYFGNKTFITDTVTTDNTGRYRVVLDSSYKSGLYKLSLSKNSYFNFIINREDIKLRTFVVNAMDSMKIIGSEENRILYEYYKQQNLFNKKMNMLAPLVYNYPKSDHFYGTIINKFNSIQKEYEDYIRDLMNELPGSFVSKYIQFIGFNIVNPELSEKEQKQIFIEKYFDNINFCDSVILNSDAIPQKVISYLSLFSDRTKTQAQLEKSYKNAVDKILDKALCNEQVFEYTLNYLIEGFEQLKYEEVLAYLSENYIPLISCVNENLKNSLEDKTGKYEKVSIGKKAPAFEIKTIENKIISLNDIDSDNTLIIFWASWCLHCKKILPAIESVSSLYPKENLETIAISLDTKKEEWIGFLNNYDFSWINASELKGWESKVALDYNIYATPTMILLDKDKKIIAKPRTVRELKEFL